MFQVFFRDGRDQWSAGPYPSEKAARDYARDYVAGFKHATVRYCVVTYAYFSEFGAPRIEQSKMFH